MENEGILDSLCDLNLFCLHYIYLPRVQRAVREFKSQWNNHGLSTQGGQTPLQLWHRGVVSHTDRLFVCKRPGCARNIVAENRER